MRIVFASLLSVFSDLKYASLATFTSAVVFTVAVWLPNIPLIFQILTTTSVSLIDKLSFLWSLYGSIATNFTKVSASYTILIAVLFGVSLTMFVYYIRQQQGQFRGEASVSSIGGLVSGFFGIGCAACGTFILSSLLGLLGAGSILTFLPLGGEEFGFLGVGLLAYSVYKTAQMIQKPRVCSI